MEDILIKIVQNKKALLNRLGPTLGCDIPTQRIAPAPISPANDKFVIAEVKKQSPSQGIIVDSFDPLELAGTYIRNGAGMLSVLTEPDFFGGSLGFLQKIKQAYPNIPILRKDFILTREEVDVSFRAGADCILLIASILTQDEIEYLYLYAKSLGLSVLVEVHNNQEIQKVKKFKPQLVGINSRNLRTFSTDLFLPFKLKSLIHWDCDLVFESGITNNYEAELAFSGGFDAILTGTAVSRDPSLVLGFAQAAKSNLGRGKFWDKLYSGFYPKNYLLKFCGITNIEDFKLVEQSSADMAGFVLAHGSPRKVDFDFIKSVPESNTLKVGVLVNQPEDYHKLRSLIEQGYLDCVQFHGNESLQECLESGLPFYQAAQIGNGRKAAPSKNRVLLDAFSQKQAGGTGKTIESKWLEAYHVQDLAPEYRSLWLAGGLNSENIRELASKYYPEMIDLSSGIEASKGKKSPKKVAEFLKELKNVRL